jgi:broad specificity phosphatase PhoE
VSTVFLVRHADHALVNRTLVGRTSGVALNSAGIRQAGLLGELLSAQQITVVQSSPRLRARQTARSIANACELPVAVVPAMDEADTGDWTGRSFDELDQDPRWHRWNLHRGCAAVPGGESMLEVQARVIRHLARTSLEFPGGRIAIVSHAEPIRAAILYYRRIPLNDFARVQVAPASITALHVRDLQGEVIVPDDESARSLVSS